MPAGLAALASNGRWQLAPHLARLNSALLDVWAGDCRRLIIEMPPRHGKSEFASRFFPAWFVGKEPDKRVILASYEAEFAATWGQKARDILREWGQPVFGARLNTSSAARNLWNVARRSGGMTTAGVGGPITGKGADLLIVDDPVKNAKEANSATIRDQIWDWWQSTAYTRLEPGGAAIIIMTRWHEDDLVGRLLRAEADGGEPWRRLRLPALAEADDPLGRAEGEALWPARYGAERLAEIRSVVGSYWFSALYQQRPQVDGGLVFRRPWFRTYRAARGADGQPTHYELAADAGVKRVPVDACYRLSVVDLAVSTSNSADWTVVSTWAVTPDRELVLLDVVRDRVEGADHMPLVRRTFERWRPSFVGIERTAYQLALVQTAVRAGLPVLQLVADRDKLSRALVASARYEAGMVYHPAAAPWLEAWEAELLAFPNGAHDDQVDTAAYAAISLMSGTATQSDAPW